MSEAVFRPASCFVCGTDNPGGLDLGPERDGDKVFVRYVASKPHLGFSRALHGGIIATLLDEVVGVACGLRTDGKCATVELSVKYRQPILEGMSVRAEGWYVRDSGRMVVGAGQIVDQAGQVLATAEGRFLKLETKHLKKFVGRDD